MPRFFLFLIVILILLVIGLFVLAGRDSERAPQRVEKVVSVENLQN